MFTKQSDTKRVMKRSITWTLASFSICFFVASPSPGQAARAKPQVLYLHTEFLPYQHRVEKDLPYRLGREMIRQAFLVAARDELGLATRDETLRETAPDAATTARLLLSERANLNGTWRLKLIAYSEGVDIQTAPALWEKTYRYDASGTKMYANMVPQLEADTRGEFLAALRAAGLSGEKPAVKSPRPPSEKIETLLDTVDFVAQYAAVREAHRAIDANGQTNEWLGVLVRGYANLSMLTQHQWNSTSEAFAARSWLYAERMIAATNKSDAALWHRAYAWALTGALHHALDDMQLIESQNPANYAGVVAAAGNRAWTALVGPYCRCDRTALKQLGEADAGLKPWATQLAFQLTSALRHSPWMYHACREVAEVCPTAYGAYAELAHHGGTLTATRTGAWLAPAAFSRFGPKSLEAIPDLPEDIRTVLPLDAAKAAAIQKLVEDPNPEDHFSVLPTYIAAELRKKARQESGPDLSWSTLACLLEEEQFVQAANSLAVAINATESSLAEDVDAVLPLVKGHRYEPYIESFRYNPRTDLGEMQVLLGSLVIVDPRYNMTSMFSRAWTVTNPAGEQIGSSACAAAHRNFTMPGMLEYLFASGSRWTPPDNERYRRMLSTEFAKIAPHSEVGLRLKIQAAKEPTLDELTEWESKLKEDPTAFARLADQYKQRGDVESAVRCYEKSLAALPTVDATRSLSWIYLEQKDYAKWEKTLLAFLKTEDLGLEHARVHQDLAYGFMHRGQWTKAKPHAVAAGETWSAWGLSAASIICEGLAEWEESEAWIREMSQNYPSTSGAQWYFWCCRTGRGDKAAAARLAERFFATVAVQPTRENQIMRGAYYLLEGHAGQALDSYRQAASFRPTFTCTYMIADLSRELGDDNGRLEVLNGFAPALEQWKAQDPQYDTYADAAGLAILELIKTGDASDNRLADIEKLLVELAPNTRGAFAYFVAKELEFLGKEKEAEKYWRRALTIPASDPNYATLAGKELADRHGTSRTDDDALDESDLWPPLAEADK